MSCAPRSPLCAPPSASWWATRTARPATCAPWRPISAAGVDHAEHLIGALLILARNERGLTVREEVDLATAAEDVLDTADVGDRRVHATPEPPAISGDPVLAPPPPPAPVAKPIPSHNAPPRTSRTTPPHAGR